MPTCSYATAGDAARGLFSHLRVERVVAQRDGFGEHFFAQQGASAALGYKRPAFFGGAGGEGSDHQAHQVAGGGGFEDYGIVAGVKFLGIFPAPAFFDGGGRQARAIDFGKLHVGLAGPAGTGAVGHADRCC